MVLSVVNATPILPNRKRIASGGVGIKAGLLRTLPRYFANFFCLTGFGEDILWSLENDSTAIFSLIGAFYAVFFIGFIPAPFIYQAFTRNEVYNTTLLEGGHRLRSNVSAPQLIWIAVSNLVVVVFTAGLMLPWAQIRIARYLADHTAVDLGSSVDDFVGVQQEATLALGDAYTDIEGIDVGLPV